MVKKITKSARFQIGSFRYDTANRELFRGEKTIHLRGKQIDILELLITNFPSTTSRENIFALLWPGETVDLHRVSVHVSKLRKVLGDELPSKEAYKLRHLQPLKNYDRGELHPTWCELSIAAKEVGRYVFEKFRANAILTFAGHSAIFANLVLVKSLRRKKMLSMPVYLALQRDWDASTNRKRPTMSGYETFTGEEVAVLVPKAFISQLKRPNKTWRIAVIDDAIVSGDVPAVLKNSLRPKLSRTSRMAFACYVCYRPVTKAIKGRKPDKVVKWLRTEKELDTFRLPCNTRVFWFGKRLPSRTTGN
jgi:hypothetical protein